MHDKVIEEIDGTKLSIVVGAKKLIFDMADVFAISEENLSTEFAQQASLYAYFSVLAAKADHFSSMMALKKDQEYANADMYYREEAVKNEQKTTEPQIKSMVTLDEDYERTCNMELNAKLDAKILKAITGALEQRASMLISLGSHLRHELDMTNMNIKERSYQAAVDTVKDTITAARNNKVNSKT